MPKPLREDVGTGSRGSSGTDEKPSPARQAGEERLSALGFALVGGEWKGSLVLPNEGLKVAARVSLPDRFPDVLPEVFVERAALPRRLAHIESSGKVCVAPTSGLLLDADRPGDLVKQALERAALEVERGLRGESDPDLQTEFLAYWKATEVRRTYSTCSLGGALREIVVANVTGSGFPGKDATLLADTEAEAIRWATNLRATATIDGAALFVPLVTSFEPPEFDASLTVKEVRHLLETHAAPQDRSTVRERLKSARLPATVLLSLPEAQKGDGRSLIGVRFERPTGEAEKQARKGFRPGHVPTWRSLQFEKDSPVTRVNLERVDHTYVVARGGATESFARKTVAVIGLGAVGSEIAEMLAAVGVGHLRLVDSDVLGPENIHRHALGVRHLHENKATALSEELGARFPHLAFEARDGKVQDVLARDAPFVTAVDLIVIALGDETLERRLNRDFKSAPPRVHAWVEPLGVGGHALACGLTGPGCFECLLVHDPEFGLVNDAALVARGQDIRRSIAGCAGTFSPFSALDARRGALEAAELAASVLAARLPGNALVSWRGDRTTFEEAGYTLSRRAAVLPRGGRSLTAGADFAQSQCPVCGTTGTSS